MPKRKILSPPNLGEASQKKSFRKAKPHRFVLEAIASIEPSERAMFGALAVYVGEKIVFILRDSRKDTQANGVWVAVPTEHQASFRLDFPNAHAVQIMGKEISGWQLLAVDAVDFEESALHACDLVLSRDHRIGKVPRK